MQLKNAPWPYSKICLLYPQRYLSYRKSSIDSASAHILKNSFNLICLYHIFKDLINEAHDLYVKAVGSRMVVTFSKPCLLAYIFRHYTLAVCEILVAK